MARSDAAGRHVPPPHRNVPAETLLLSPHSLILEVWIVEDPMPPQKQHPCAILSHVDESAWRNSAKHGSPAAWESQKRPFQLPTIYSTGRHEPGD